MLTDQGPTELQRFANHLAQRADLNVNDVDTAACRVWLHHTRDCMTQRQLVHYTMLLLGRHRCREDRVRKNADIVCEIVIVAHICQV